MKSDGSKKIRKQVEELQVEIYRLTSIIENLPGCIYWKDKNGVYLEQNNYSRQIMQEVGLYPNMV